MDEQAMIAESAASTRACFVARVAQNDRKIRITRLAPGRQTNYNRE
jgi:hypothetical protein